MAIINLCIPFRCETKAYIQIVVYYSLSGQKYTAWRKQHTHDVESMTYTRKFLAKTINLFT